MGVTHINKLKDPNILFGIVLPQVIYNLYEVSISEESFENAIKSGLGIEPNRMIKLVEAVQAQDKNILILVIYDKISGSKSFFKDRLNLKVESFDFDIYNYDFNREINIEEQILLQKGWK